MFKESRLGINKNTTIEVDLGYLGIQKFHDKVEIPAKNYKNKQLTKDDKYLNLIKSSSRIIIENINAKIKVFKIFSDKYRNRRKRLKLRFNLICGLINYDSIF